MRKLFALAAIIVLCHPATAADFTVEDFLGEWCGTQGPPPKTSSYTITPTRLKITSYIVGQDPNDPRRMLTSIRRDLALIVTKFEIISRQTVVHWVEEGGKRETGQTVFELSDDKQQLTVLHPPDADKEPQTVLRRCS